MDSGKQIEGTLAETQVDDLLSRFERFSRSQLKEGVHSGRLPLETLIELWGTDDDETRDRIAAVLDRLGLALVGPLLHMLCDQRATVREPAMVLLRHLKRQLEERCELSADLRKMLKDPEIVEGSAEAGERVAFVDDVVTSGKSVIDAFEHCKQALLNVVQIIVMVDQGGVRSGSLHPEHQQACPPQSSTGLSDRAPARQSGAIVLVPRRLRRLPRFLAALHIVP